MARVTVEECLKHFDNRFDLVLAASKRARQVLEGGIPLVDRENDKPAVVALREIEGKHVSQKILDEEEISSLEKDMLAEFSAKNLKPTEAPWNIPSPDSEEDEESTEKKASAAGTGETPSASAADPVANSAASSETSSAEASAGDKKDSTQKQEKKKAD